MATAAILNNQPLPAQLHMAYDIPTVVCGSFWRVDKIQNGVTVETEVPK